MAHGMSQKTIQASPMLAPGTQKKEPPSILYDFKKWEEPWEINQYQTFLKKHQRLFKELHDKYMHAESVKKPLAVARNTFEQSKETYD